MAEGSQSHARHSATVPTPHALYMPGHIYAQSDKIE
jgi:hypothetical protein